MVQEYPCELSPTKMCRYGGSKRYNYGGGMSGTQSWCRFPGVNRAVFPMLGNTLECPLHNEVE